MPTDVLAPLGARTSAGRVMKKLGSAIYVGRALRVNYCDNYSMMLTFGQAKRQPPATNIEGIRRCLISNKYLI